MPPLMPVTTVKNGFEADNELASKRDAEHSSLDYTSIRSAISKRVAFCSEITVQEVPHLSDLSEEDKNRVWTTPEEMYEIAAQVRETIDKLKQTEYFIIYSDANENCLRGLENLLNDEQESRSQEAIYAVLDAQTVQWCEGIRDDQELADIYRNLTYVSLLDAHGVAMRDAMETNESVGCVYQNLTCVCTLDAHAIALRAEMGNQEILIC